MEVKPGILNGIVFHVVDDFAELNTDTLLGAFSIDQVHHVLPVIWLESILHVFASRLKGFIEVGICHNCGCPLNVWF